MVVVRALREADVAAVDPLLMAAYGSPKSFAPRLRRLLEIEPEGWLLAEEGGRPLGTGGLVVFGSSAYVGLVATEPSAQGRGVATRVMRRLLGLAEERGCARVLLDASAAGRPLYEKLGFVADDGIGLWQRPALPRPLPGTANPSSGWSDEPRILSLADEVRTEGGAGRKERSASPALPEELLAFDGRCWGERRDRALELFAGADPARCFLARGPEGRLQGYGLLQAEAGVVGPLLALHKEAAAALLARLLAAADPGELVAYIPAANEAGARLFGAAGFALQRSLTHMRLGPPLDAERRRLVYSQANFALG